MKTSFIVLLCLLPSIGLAAGFDCSKATTQSERLICADPGLNKMDELLQALYRRALKKTHEKEVLKGLQLGWLLDRENACSNGDVNICEQVYLRGYRELVDYYYQSVKGPLLDGMLKPGDSFSADSPDGPADLLDESRNYWGQKALIKIADGQVMSLRSAVVGGTPYLLYVTKVHGQDGYQVYEYNTLTRKIHLIDQLSKWQEWVSMMPTLFCVVKNRLYYPQDGKYRNIELSRQQLTAYDIGNRKAPQAVSGAALMPDQDTLFFEFYTASADGRWLATVSEYVGMSAPYPNFNQMKAFFDHHPEKASPPLIYVYDRLRKTGYGLDFDWSGEQGWVIGGLAFHDRLPVLFFDNHGPMACIWTYDLELKKLVKIVPQHEAKLPRPFTYKGQDYVAFVINNDSENKSSWIYLAAGKIDLQ